MKVAAMTPTPPPACDALFAVLRRLAGETKISVAEREMLLAAAVELEDMAESLAEVSGRTSVTYHRCAPCGGWGKVEFVGQNGEWLQGPCRVCGGSGVRIGAGTGGR